MPTVKSAAHTKQHAVAMTAWPFFSSLLYSSRKGRHSRLTERKRRKQKRSSPAVPFPNPSLTANPNPSTPSPLSPMASYLSHLSSPERDAVDAIVSQAVDLCALEQVAALNTSHLSDSSLLPTDLESRFRKLKTFPRANPQHHHQQQSRIPPRHLDQGKENIPRSLNRCESVPNPSIDSGEPEEKKPPPEPQTSSSPPLKPDAEKDSEKPGPTTGFASSSSISLASPRDSPSPPRRRCCFVLSPKRVQRGKGKGGDWGRNDDVLSDMGTFSMKEQQRKLKKALKEQEKASREAEKMVEWVKQASARMNMTAIDELLSDAEEELK